ncbi:DUF485 domain-containing protein [Protaetiibacter intestinalis]|uniref:DUF485 domain-containing protein n=1 Tax=Protaetiibacter intestinalis TaxID=2419774 RepID=A0A387B7J8_9MICO|nr:DUF485 domain-containing protein [Protaetiibacter intestinalis]AYF97728.1 DUF485 domain-containing protein [Protaetiibacter intestinalis]
MGDEAPSSVTEEGVDFAGIQQSDRFQQLKKRHRSFVFPVLALALVWYFAYVLLAGYAPDFMAIPVFGSVNVGLLIGLGQVATTFIITMVYVSYANRKLDPLAEELRDDAEAGKAVK